MAAHTAATHVAAASAAMSTTTATRRCRNDWRDKSKKGRHARTH
jgi:hypothetical protein